MNRFTDYTNAKKEAEEFFERTITDRIHRYNEARTTAIARAGTRGAPVSVNTLFGDMLFSAESDSAMAGVAATVSLAYSAASLEGGSQSRE